MAKAWLKRMIWVFGIWIMMSVDEMIYWITVGTPMYKDYGNGIALIYLGILVIPLFFMEDDKK